MPTLPWPTAAPLPIEPLRPVLDRLISLSMAHPEDVTAIPGLAMVDGDVKADPPPALEQIVDEFGGIILCGIPDLILLTSERGTEGPYTMLGEHTTYYPLHEDPDSESAVVLTLDQQGVPGAVYGIGDDLALRLAAPDLGTFLRSYADALEATVSELDRVVEPDARVEDRARAAHALMRHHLFDAITGTDTAADLAEEAADGATSDGWASASADGQVAPRTTGLPADQGEAQPLPLEAARHDDLPAGTVALWDLRTAPLGIAVPVIDADIDADPLDYAVFWRDQGLVVGLAPRA